MNITFMLEFVSCAIMQLKHEILSHNLKISGDGLNSLHRRSTELDIILVSQT